MKYTDILYQIYHIFQSCTRQSVPNILIYCTKYTIYMKFTDILYQIYHIFQSCTRKFVPNILIYCTKYTIYFKAAWDNLYQIYHIYCTKYTIYCTKYTIYFKTILNSSSIQTKFCFKPIPHITYTSSKLSKNISISFGYYYKYFGKKNNKI